jgi:hypothetical protein
MAVDRREFCAVAYLRGTKHKIYEDSFRMLHEYPDAAKAVNSLATAAQAAGSNDDIAALLVEVCEIWL